jgi:hypothetical protein
MARPRSRRREAGSAILITLVIILALLGGGAVLVSMQLHATKSAGVVREKIGGTMCAEAGLAAARALVAANYQSWGPSLCNPPPPRGTGTCTIGAVASEPSWLAAVDHDLDDDGVADFVLTLVDNDDEAPATNNMAVDNDLQVFVVATCVKNPELPVTVSELVQFTPGGTCYPTQLGGCAGTGNNN